MTLTRSAFAAGLVAGMEALLLQWTGGAVPRMVLAMDFAVSAVLLTLVVAPILAAWAFFRGATSSESFPAGTILALAFYDLSRIRTERMSWLEPTCLVLIATSAIGAWCLLRPAANRAGRGWVGLMGSELLVAVTAATWAAMHLGGRFTPVPVVLALFASAAAAQAALARSLFARTHRVHPVAAALSPVAVFAAFSIATYPIVPGVAKPEVRARDRRPAVAAHRVPNVILVVMDTVRADHLSLYGYGIATSPHLARFAEHAYVFRRAIANSNWSLPSHATLLTGLLPHQHGAHTVIAALEKTSGPGATVLGDVAQQPLPASRKTVVERLRALGYRTGVVAANYAWLTDDSGLLRGFDYVDSDAHALFAWEPFCAAYLRHQPIAALTDLYESIAGSKRSAEEIVDRAADFLKSGPRGPFLLLLNFMDAHAPYASASRADGVREIRDRLHGEHWEAVSVEGYDRSIAYLDHQLGRLFGLLRDRGLFDDSLIVVTSDHGERFGSGARGWHGGDLSQASVHVPLVIKMPGQTRGETVDRWAQLADVAPTILEALGLPLSTEFFGSPLARQPRAVIAENYLASGGSPVPLRAVPIEEIDEKLPTQWVLFDRQWKLVRNADGGRSLYDLSEDPDESEDLARRRPEIEREMDERLAALLPSNVFTDYRRPVGRRTVSQRTLEKLKSLGYAQ